MTLLEVPAVPEPSTIAVWSLLGLALCGFGCLRRRGRQQR
ncbi:MAG: PEP-CTERM sorting domain-containing protein [Planctomycetales bacterium]|nr:PEP-CTERM sorting domain-containing protein [Planctomycetales bacterium]